MSVTLLAKRLKCPSPFAIDSAKSTSGAEYVSGKSMPVPRPVFTTAAISDACPSGSSNTLPGASHQSVSYDWPGRSATIRHSASE